MKPLFSLALLALFAWQSAHAQDAAVPQPAPVEDVQPAVLEPFVATYEAYNKGDLAGNATMQVVHNGGAQWRVDLGIKGNRGFAGILGLNIQQSTVFDDIDGQFRPLTQSTIRKGLFMGKKINGVYDWNAHSARWQGSIKDERSKPVALRDGDMSGLLINLAVIRDARPGARLQYRFVDGGRVRDHIYQVADDTETIKVGELSYNAMRVSRVNGGNDETIFWVVNGVPTPVRMLQREDGRDGIDLRLIEYQGIQ
ncbi:DUF3108 domain-containing protein [Luteimonas sp. 22616]|jgi:hypothetical protein|uniref:DUF3108 domain-containing protein n=1 Tax=Luteimonas sp. 22616 TaxID=3453951 RepID=UPI003F8337E3